MLVERSGDEHPDLLERDGRSGDRREYDSTLLAELTEVPVSPMASGWTNLGLPPAADPACSAVFLEFVTPNTSG